MTRRPTEGPSSRPSCENRPATQASKIIFWVDIKAFLHPNAGRAHGHTTSPSRRYSPRCARSGARIMSPASSKGPPFATS
jgi:hypothetical protein